MILMIFEEKTAKFSKIFKNLKTKKITLIELPSSDFFSRFYSRVSRFFGPKNSRFFLGFFSRAENSRFFSRVLVKPAAGGIFDFGTQNRWKSL